VPYNWDAYIRILSVITLVGGQLWSIAVEYDNHVTVAAGDKHWFRTAPEAHIQEVWCVIRDMVCMIREMSVYQPPHHHR